MKAVFDIDSAQPPFTRRVVLLGGLSAALAACTQTIMEQNVAQSVTIRRVSVITTNISRYSVRELRISRERFAADLKAEIEGKLGRRQMANGNAELVVSVARVWLKSPAESLFFGGPSFIDTQVTVRRISDGVAISGPMQFSGTSGGRLGGLFGAMGAPSALDDYRTTLAGFATMLNAALFEGGATSY